VARRALPRRDINCGCESARRASRATIPTRAVLSADFCAILDCEPAWRLSNRHRRGRRSRGVRCWQCVRPRRESSRAPRIELLPRAAALARPLLPFENRVTRAAEGEPRRPSTHLVDGKRFSPAARIDRQTATRRWGPKGRIRFARIDYDADPPPPPPPDCLFYDLIYFARSRPAVS